MFTLWIAFELYLWDIEHNITLPISKAGPVVNCFWIVSLRYWAQLWMKDYIQRRSCELLLNCIFEILSTTVARPEMPSCPLWIAFELYLWDIEHNQEVYLWMLNWVVNCFWIVSLRYWAQQKMVELYVHHGCELLLNCIFEILSTTNLEKASLQEMLWIAFELYLWDIEHNFSKSCCAISIVVNCFWIVSLRYWAQHFPTAMFRPFSCELLLNCIFEILSTTVKMRTLTINALWIAFELYLWDIEHNQQENNTAPKTVVNCFWIVSLRYWAQHTASVSRCSICCELLLNCIFEILSTTDIYKQDEHEVLWIAFELYLWDIEHNCSGAAHAVWFVVNCFWIVSLRYWAQPAVCNGYTLYCCELLLNCIFEILSTTVFLLAIFFP